MEKNERGSKDSYTSKLRCDYICSICSKAFESKKGLGGHKKAHHPKKPPQNQEMTTTTTHEAISGDQVLMIKQEYDDLPSNNNNNNNNNQPPNAPPTVVEPARLVLKIKIQIQKHDGSFRYFHPYQAGAPIKVESAAEVSVKKEAEEIDIDAINGEPVDVSVSKEVQEMNFDAKKGETLDLDLKLGYN